MEAAVTLGGEGLVPFYGLLEGGRDGELFAELEDYFYYAQLRRLVPFFFLDLVMSNAVFPECTIDYAKRTRGAVLANPRSGNPLRQPVVIRIRHVALFHKTTGLINSR